MQSKMKTLFNELNTHVNEGRCLLIKDIFSPACDYAGIVGLNKSY